MNIFKENKIKILTNILIGVFFVVASFCVVPCVTIADVTQSYTSNSAGSYTFGLGGGSGGRSGGTPRTFYDLVVNTIIGGMLSPLITLIVSAAVVVFIYGVFKFVRSDGKEKEAGKDIMVWGIVGLFIMVSVWGLVNILQGTFNLNDTSVDINRVLLR